MANDFMADKVNGQIKSLYFMIINVILSFMLNKEKILTSFWDKLKRAENRILFLDYDGTLAPFKIRRDEAAPYPGIRDILNRIIMAQKSRIIIVSGRSVKDLLPLLGLEKQPEIWGAHGLERLFPDGRHVLQPVSKNTLSGLLKAASYAKKNRLWNQCEEKPGCLALHLRGVELEKSREIKTKIMAAWSTLACESNLRLHEFDGGIELRTMGSNKGMAVEAILDESGKDTTAAFLGDDLTDEDAFRALGRRGISVLVRNQWRQTAADLWLKPPDELLDFLEKWYKTCGAKN